MKQGASQKIENKAAQIMRDIGAATKKAAQILAQKSEDDVNRLLQSLSENLSSNTQVIIDANVQDVSAARKKNLTPALIDRLFLNEDRIHSITKSVLSIAALDNPVGVILEETTRPNGLIIEKTSVPIGVLGMIYESRPNVTVDAAALCLKSRNGVVLRGGSESFHSSRVFHNIIQETLRENDFPADCVSMMPSTDRALVGEMLKAHDFIDVIIPRGGKGLTGRVMSEALMPVFAHLDGNCHIYIHASAKKELAKKVIKNAKLRRTGICGAAESLLFDQKLNEAVIKEILDSLISEGCEVFGDEAIQKFDSNIKAANEDDWSTEYLDKKISAKMVADINEAIEHINQYGSHHTDAILAEDGGAVTEFTNRVDSAIVMHNTSTQFADGGEFGMGAEIGIGTGKLHARGPVGIRQLTTFKYIVRGQGQTRP